MKAQEAMKQRGKIFTVRGTIKVIAKKAALWYLNTKKKFVPAPDDEFVEVGTEPAPVKKAPAKKAPAKKAPVAKKPAAKKPAKKATAKKAAPKKKVGRPKKTK